ncbi:uncharacterized protein LOC133824050 [Humulus lupulus]|uniref:uncharacterized protein LOC133824050 n=1 Tax=Humulus lupulus TaxID=3486 RepID=UPI002B411855|nr:uncharacterized protein LOC133824050 [Humulus lupulus]
MTSSEEISSQTSGPNPIPAQIQAQIQSFSSMGSIYSHDTNSFHITAHKLDGRSYLQWAQSVKLVICGRGKLGYLTGDFPTPHLTDSTYKVWQAKNYIVLAWLINSMDRKISRMYLFFKISKEVWDAAKKMYSDLGNASQIFEICTKLKEIKQGTHTVTQYFSDLQDLWQELDLYMDTTPLCATCTTLQRQQLEKERVFEFLTRLNNNLDEVQGRLVSCSPFPDTEEAFSEVKHEEARRRVMLTTPELPVVESSVLVSKSGPPPFGRSTLDPRPNRTGQRPWCDQYQRHGHTRSTCWEIHGKPPNWTPRCQNDKKTYHTQTSDATNLSTHAAPSFSQEQLEQLYTFFSQSFMKPKSGPESHSASVAHSGHFSSAFQHHGSSTLAQLIT